MRQTGHFGANLLASCGMVLGWGFFLIMGVRDPEGGVKALWPIFGISNQILAGIALCLATTIILKMQLRGESKAGGREWKGGRPALALITLIPLVWVLAVTMTAGAQKIFHSKPGIGFMAANRVLREQAPKLETALTAAEAGGDETALAKARENLRLNRIKRFNNSVDALATGFFMLLVAAIVALSVREWVLLLARKRIAELHETAPVWLPDYAVAEARPRHLIGLLALGFALSKELSGEAQLERARQAQLSQRVHPGHGPAAAIPYAGKTDGQLYVELTEKRYNGVRRCC
jgi:carbon starvation protein